jgi:hypothetical protein
LTELHLTVMAEEREIEGNDGETDDTRDKGADRGSNKETDL